MSGIDPNVLKQLRGSKGWSQAELAENAKFGKEPPINKDTISRLERNPKGNTRGSVLKKLARALGVEINVLTGDAPIPDGKSEEARTARSSIPISDQARNALYLVYDRYYIQPWQIVEMAPALFCWVAEASLRARQREIDAIKSGFDAAREQECRTSHLRPSDLADLEEKIVAENESIADRDLLGFKVEDAGFANFQHDWDNPFSKFLREIFAEFEGVVSFQGFSLLDFPEYFVCPEEAKRIAGGDETLSEMILRGHIALSEMPKEIDRNFDVSKRVEWIRAQGEEFKSRIASHTSSRKIGYMKGAVK
jgi:transcriptional regulator with XRE-family HTH domain